MTKIIVLSDIHANQPALEAVCNACDQEPIDEIWFLGDLLGYGPFPTQVYYKLQFGFGIKPAVWLAGNHDLAIGGEDSCYENMNPIARKCVDIHKNNIPPDIINTLVQKPVQLTREVDNLVFCLAHGFPFPDKESMSAVRTYDWTMAPNTGNSTIERIRTYYAKSKVWLVGHSHRQTAWWRDGAARQWRQRPNGFGQPLNGGDNLFLPKMDDQGRVVEEIKFDIDFKDEHPESLLILNPGSIGFPKDGTCGQGNDTRIAKYLMLEVVRSHLQVHFHFAPYSATPVTDEWERAGYPGDLRNYLKC